MHKELQKEAKWNNKLILGWKLSFRMGNFLFSKQYKDYSLKDFTAKQWMRIELQLERPPKN